MYHKSLYLLFITLLFSPFTTLQAQESWTKEQLQVIDAMERLSASTGTNGKGAQEYGEVLHDDFTRWTLGSTTINDKKTWVEGVKEWFENGWRVSSRDSKSLELLVEGNYAFTRRIVTETYSSPSGKSSSSNAAVAETWVRENKKWLLLRVHAIPIDEN